MVLPLAWGADAGFRFLSCLRLRLRTRFLPFWLPFFLPNSLCSSSRYSTLGIVGAFCSRAAAFAHTDPATSSSIGSQCNVRLRAFFLTDFDELAVGGGGSGGPGISGGGGPSVLFCGG